MSITISGSGAITGASTSYSFDQAVSIAGTVTYEDVSNVDSVGIITAQSGIRVTGGSVGIGTDNPSYLVDAHTSSGNAQLRVKSGGDLSQLILESTDTSGFSQINFADAGSNNIGMLQYFHSDNHMEFTVNAAERLRITSSGNIQTNGGNVHIDDNGEFAIFEEDTSLAMTNSSKISMDFASNIARIRSSHNGSAVSRPLAFFVGSSEKLRIDSSGRVGINTTGFADTATALNIKNGASGSEHTFLDIECNTNETCRVRFSEDGSTYPGEIRYNTQSQELQFYANSSEAMRIDSSGNLLIGRTSTGNTGDGHSLRGGDGCIFSRDATGETLQVSRNSSNGKLIEFRSGDSGNATAIGNISKNGASSVAYNTSESDRRVKKNIEPWTDEILQHFKTLQPKKFHFNIQSDEDPLEEGYIAQDLVDAFPEAYPSILQEVDGEEVFRYSFNPSGMVKYLMKALQEEIVKREALEARIAAIEGN